MRLIRNSGEIKTDSPNSQTTGARRESRNSLNGEGGPCFVQGVSPIARSRMQAMEYRNAGCARKCGKMVVRSRT